MSASLSSSTPANATQAPRSIKTIGYIGLGNAGFSMASNLPRSGYKVVVHDANPAQVARAVKEWPNTTASKGDPAAFQDCDMIITMLPQGDVVREVLLGKDHLARDLRRGTIVVDTSSSSPFGTIKLAEELATSDQKLVLVDSPITQTYMHATDAGEATLMVGAPSKEVFAIVEPVLKCMARYIFHMGPVGHGHAMKTLNNYIMASSICALSDSLVTGKRYGLDPQQMLEVCNVGTSVCFPTLDTFRRDGITGRYNSGFGLALLVKDLGITQDFMDHNDFGEGHENGTALPGLLRGYLSEALSHVQQNADHTAALIGWEKRAGLQVTQEVDTVEDIRQEDFDQRLRGLNRKS